MLKFPRSTYQNEETNYGGRGIAILWNAVPFLLFRLRCNCRSRHFVVPLTLNQQENLETCPEYVSSSTALSSNGGYLIDIIQKWNGWIKATNFRLIPPFTFYRTLSQQSL